MRKLYSWQEDDRKWLEGLAFKKLQDPNRPMRLTVWLSDFSDGLVNGRFYTAVLTAGICRIVKWARNFLVLEGPEWALKGVYGA